MISRNLSRRLRDLKSRFRPAAEPVIAQITYVSPNGSEEDGPRFIIEVAEKRQTGSTWLAGGGRCGLPGRPYREGHG